MDKEDCRKYAKGIMKFGILNYEYNNLMQYKIGDIVFVELNKNNLEFFRKKEEISEQHAIGSVWIYGGCLILCCNNQIVYSQKVKGWNKMSHDEKLNLLSFVAFWVSSQFNY